VACASPPDLDTAKQAAALKDAIAARPSGVVVSCLSEKSLDPLIQSAADEGIPVITYDSDCPHSVRTGFYGIDNRLTGSNAADLLIAAMFPSGDDGPKQVAILSGDRDAENLLAREDGFRDELVARNANVSLATYRCNETAQDCGSTIEDQILARYPDLDGLFVTGFWGLQSACTCNEKDLGCSCDADDRMTNWKAAAAGKLKTVSCDTLPFELTLMKDGYVSALISQDYFNWGYMSVTLMFRHLTEGLAVNNFVQAESVQVVSGSNAVDDMLSKWETMEPGPELALVCKMPDD
jgi:ribose transport system substrate-binding protein